MRISTLLTLGLPVLAVAATAWLLSAQEAPAPFPHAAHTGLFPNCNACHGALDRPAGETWTVDAQDCAACHDGEVQPTVQWTAPPAAPVNLVFEHTQHDSVPCAVCHGGGPDRMGVIRARPETCFPCHDGSAHLAPDTACDTCHRPLADSPRPTVAAIAGYPQPDTHGRSDFMDVHGDLARAGGPDCQTCHARELCETCHVNGELDPTIAAFARDPRVAELVADRPGRWPLPESHREADWVYEHQPAGGNLEECAACHAQESCSGCHFDVPVAGVGSLARVHPDRPQGVRLMDASPPEHGPGFERFHAGAAVTGAMDCAACHSPASCDECHLDGDGGTGGFHPGNFMQRHAADAYAADTDCASCHNNETFCRDCHMNVGLSDSPASASYHESQPLWLITHGQAARQGMATCQSCHEQDDCMRCHSAKTGWRVNPHGRGFDADRVGDRALFMCAECHYSDPR